MSVERNALVRMPGQTLLELCFSTQLRSCLTTSVSKDIFNATKIRRDSGNLLYINHGILPGNILHQLPFLLELQTFQNSIKISALYGRFSEISSSNCFSTKLLTNGSCYPSKMAPEQMMTLKKGNMSNTTKSVHISRMEVCS